MNIFTKLILPVSLTLVGGHATEVISNSETKEQIPIHKLNLNNIWDFNQAKEIYIDPVFAHSNYQLAKDMRDVFEANEIDYWASFGTLLGAQRHGGIIPWDDDLDFGVNITSKEKLLTLKPVFDQLGYVLKEDEAELVGYKLEAKKTLTLNDGQVVRSFADLFLFQLQDDRYVLSCEKGRNFFTKGWFLKDQVETKTRYKFGEFDIAGPTNLWAGKMPNDSESLDKNNPRNFFTRCYDVCWQTHGWYYWTHFTKVATKYLLILSKNPEPALPTGPMENRYGQLIQKKDLEKERDNTIFWNDFYAQDLVGRKPSTFMAFLTGKGYIKPGKTLVDVGCGNGRDTINFLKLNVNAVGIDGSEVAIESNNQFVLENGICLDKKLFHVVKISSEDYNKLLGYRNYDYIYARFFIHSLKPDQQEIFFKFLREIKSGATVLFEYRTINDPMFARSEKISETEGRTDHYRRYLNHDDLCSQLENCGFNIKYRHEAQGLSICGNDNPVLGRVVAKKY